MVTPAHTLGRPRAAEQNNKGILRSVVCGTPTSTLTSVQESPPHLRRSGRISKPRQALGNTKLTPISASAPTVLLGSCLTLQLQTHPSPLPPKPCKRKREHIDHHVILIEPPPKRLRPTHLPVPRTEAVPRACACALSESRLCHIDHWIQQGQVWPNAFFVEDKWQRLLAKNKSMASPQRKRSNPSLSTSATPSDTRAEKSAPYKHPSYMLVLEKEPGSYKDNFKLGIGEDSKTLRQSLLDTKEHIPENTIFRDDLFDDTCKRLEGKNEARIFKDCHPLMVPGVETHALLSTNPDLNVAVESVNEGWNNSIPVTKSSPQPDHAVGFGRAAFLDHQLQKLQPFLGDPYLSSSYFLGTYYMRFPFLTCKVKRGSAGLNIADRQNLHSMTLAVRGIVELFRLVNRAQELHRRSLAFSVSHDNENVRIHGHYPAFDRDKTTYWRHQILKYDFTGQEGLHKWTDQGLMVDDNPEPDASESTGFSEQLGDQDLVEVPESRSTHVDQQQITPTTSTHMDQPGSKRKMKGRS